MDDNKTGWKVLERVKAKKKKEQESLAKEPSEAERLFSLFFPGFQHWQDPQPPILLPFNPETDIPFFKQAALAILKTGIIGENGLKGHAGHKKDFPVNGEYLIVDLVDKHYNYTDVNFFPGDILNIFDGYFDNMATLARFAGITDKKIDNVNKILQIWRDKISQALSQGNFPANWRELVREELISSYKYHPKTKAEAFAVVFLRHAPQDSDNRIATWANDVLKSLSDSTVSKSKLREYIKKERKLRPYLTQNLSKNPL